MAIKNATDLLVYKKTSPAQKQITRIKVKNSTPLKDFTSGENITLNNVADADNDIHDGITASVTTNSGTGVLNAIVSTIVGTPHWYTNPDGSTPVLDGVWRYVDFQNQAVGAIPLLEVISGTAEFKAGAVEIVLIQPGQSVVYQPIAYSTSASISMNTDLRDITTKDSEGWQENVAGVRSFEMSTDALWDVNNAVGVESAVNDLVSGDSVDIKFSDRVRNLVDTEEVYGDNWFPAPVLDQTKHLEDPFNQFTAAKFKINTNTSYGAVYYKVPIALVEGKNVTWSFYVKGTSNCQACNFRFYEDLGSGTESGIPFVSYSILEGQGSITASSNIDLKITGLSTSAWTRVKVTSEVISGTDFRSVLPLLYPGATINSQTTSDEIITASWQVETGTTASDYQNPTEVDCYQGKAFVNSVSIDAGTEENATYSASFTGTSELFVNGLGHELIGDPYFDDGTNVWDTTGEATISNGVARIYSSAGVFSEIFILDTVVIGKKYCLEYTVSSYISGGLAVAGAEESIPSSPGTHKVHFTADVLTKFSLKREGVTDISLTYVSLKEVFS